MIGYLPAAEAGPAPLTRRLEEACRNWPSRPALTFAGSTLTYEILAAVPTTIETVEPELPRPPDPAILYLTSGTTGEPKAVVESVAAHSAKMQLFTDDVQPGTDDLLPSPTSRSTAGATPATSG